MPLWLEMFPARRVFDQNDVGVLLQQVPHSPAGGSLMFPLCSITSTLGYWIL